MPNLLKNPSFEKTVNGEAYYRWHGIDEVKIPHDWMFWYAQADMRAPTPPDPRFPGRTPQTQDNARPELVVWRKQDAPANERDLFWWEGGNNIKGFKGDAPTWWAIYQMVEGLTVGAQYRFTVHCFLDFVATYSGTQKVFAPDPLSGEVRVYAHGMDEDIPPDFGWLDGEHARYGQRLTLNHDFTATETDMVVGFETRSRWGIKNNGVFLDDFSLEPLGVTVPVPSPTPTPLPQPGTLSAFVAAQEQLVANLKTMHDGLHLAETHAADVLEMARKMLEATK